MSLLHVYPNALRERARQIEAAKTSDEEIMKQIRILVLGLDETWKGHAAEAYMNRYLERQNELSEFYKTLEEFIVLLNETAQEAENVDNELLRAVRQI